MKLRQRRKRYNQIRTYQLRVENLIDEEFRRIWARARRIYLGIKD